MISQYLLHRLNFESTDPLHSRDPTFRHFLQPLLLLTLLLILAVHGAEARLLKLRLMQVLHLPLLKLVPQLLKRATVALLHLLLCCLAKKVRELDLLVSFQFAFHS